MAERKESRRKEPEAADQRLIGGSREELERLVHELKTHQEELDAQQSQLLEAQHALELVRDRYEELFDFAPVGYVALDSGGVIREANLAAAALFGIERASLFGRPLFLHVPEAERRVVMDHVTRCRRGENRVESEVTLRRSHGGAEIPVQLTSAPVQRGGSVVFLTALIDLRDRKRMEEEQARIRDEQARMRQDEQLAHAASDAKDRFLAVLSHELRTPLTPIVLALDAMQQGGSIPEPLRPTLEMIRRNISLETRLIDDLLDVSRIVQGKMKFAPETVDLHDLVREVIQMLEADVRNAEVVTDLRLSAGAHHVYVDPVRLRQVLWNVLNNALRNTPPGGAVAVSTTNEVPQRITFSVRDTGKGIEPALLARIFNLFEQGADFRQRGIGLGLGLPISKSIVEAHGGAITVASEGIGRGATVEVHLPVTVEKTKRAQVASPSHRRQPQARCVLLVEDNEDSAVALAELLKMHGYDVRLAGSVREALDLVDGVDVVISDIGLPDGTGHDLMRRISATRRVPGIALSGYGTTEDLQKSAEAGFDRHIVKPVEPQYLLDALQSLTG